MVLFWRIQGVGNFAARSGASLTVVGVPVLMADNEHANLRADVAVDERIRKPGERKRTPVLASRCTHLGKLFQEREQPLKLSQEAPGKSVTGLAPVEPEGLSEVFARLPGETSRSTQFSAKPSHDLRARDSGAGTGFDLGVASCGQGVPSLVASAISVEARHNAIK